MGREWCSRHKFIFIYLLDALCGMRGLSSLTTHQTLDPTMEAWILNPWTRGKSQCFRCRVIQILSDFCGSRSVSLPSCIACRLPGEDRHVSSYVCHQLGTPQSKQRCCFISTENKLNLLRQAVWAVWPGSLLLNFLEKINKLTF